jgi:protein-disulfide isomerase
MPHKKEDREVEEYIERKDSGIAKAIIVGSIIIAASNLFSGSGLSLKGPTAMKASPAASAAAAASPGQLAAPTPPAKVTMALGHFPTKGDKNAKIAVIEFADFRCPFCEQYFTKTEPTVMKDYVDSGKVKYAFRNFQFLGPASLTAGNAAECANDQGKFWDYHTWLYKNQPPESDVSLYTSDKLTEAAGTLGLNTAQFKTCLDSTKFAKNLTDDQNEGSTGGISGTPSFIIGKLDPTGTKVVDGTLLVGAQPYSAFQAAIDPLLK